MDLFQPDGFGERTTLERRLRPVELARERAQQYMKFLAAEISLPATKKQSDLQGAYKRG